LKPQLKYLEIFMVNTLTYCICSKKCLRRTNRTNKTQLFLETQDSSSWEITLIEANKVAKSYVCCSLSKLDFLLKLLFWEEITKVKPSLEFMAFSMKSKEDIKFHCFKHSAIASTISLSSLWSMRKSCACTEEFRKICIRSTK